MSALIQFTLRQDRQLARSARRIALALAWCIGAASAGAALAADPNPDSESVILVATNDLSDPTYWHTVIVAKPVGNGLHVGVILNRQTDTSMATLFPAHEPSRKVAENVFFGGPMSRAAVAAVVREAPPQNDGVIAFSKDLYLVMQVDVIDSIIETHPNDARYYLGNVVWRPGELYQELERGLWHVLPVSSDIVFRKNTESLWRELDAGASLLSASLASPLRFAALGPALNLAH